MATNTPNLDLHKKDPLTDGNDYFDVNTMLNDNWDKIDTNAKATDDRLKKVEEPTHGAPVMNSEKINHNSDALFGKYKLNIEGETMTNILPKLNAAWETDRYTKTLSPKIYRPNTSLTIVNNSNNDIVMHIGTGSTGTYIRSITISAYSSQLEAFTDENIYQVVGTGASGWQNNAVDKDLFNSSIMVLEGNQTTIDIEYFEGTRSAFEGIHEGLESVSENLFNINNELLVRTGHNQDCAIKDDKMILISIGTGNIASIPTRVKPNTTYTFKVNDTNILPSSIRILGTNTRPASSPATPEELYQPITTTFTFTTGSNINWVTIGLYTLDLVVDDYIGSVELVEGTIAPTTYTKHDFHALEIGKALKALGVVGGLKRVNAAYDEVKDGKLYKRTEKENFNKYTYEDLSGVYVDLYSITVNDNTIMNQDYITIDGKSYKYEAIDADTTDKQYSWRTWESDKIIIRVPKGIVPSSAVSLIYQLAQVSDPIDLNLPNFNCFDKGTLIQNTKVPASVTYSYPANLGQSIKDVQEQVAAIEQRVTILDKYGSKPLDIDYTDPIKSIEANVGDTPSIEVTGSKLTPNYHNINKTALGGNSTFSKISNGYNIAGTGAWVQGFFDLTGLKPNTLYTIIGKVNQKGTTTAAAYDLRYLEAPSSTVWSEASILTNDEIQFTFTTSSSGNIRVYMYSNLTGNSLTSDCDFTEISIFEDDKTNESIPYRNSVQPLQNPSVEVVNGDNLFDHNKVYYAVLDSNSLKKGIYRRSNEAINIFEWLNGNEYKIGCTSDNYRGSTLHFKNLIPNTEYTFSVDVSDISSGARFQIYKDGDSLIFSTTGRKNKTFTSTEDGTLTFTLETNGIAGTAVFSNLMLNEGNIEKEYNDYGDGTVIFPTELCSENDKITWNGGATATVEHEWKKVLLDGSLDWIFNNDSAGAKEVRIDIPIQNSIVYDPLAICRKYDGTILTNMTNIVWDGAKYDTFNLWNNNKLYLQLKDTDTGWGNGYNPTADEIKVYFYGWKMYDEDTNPDGSGTFSTGGNKHWARRVGGVGGIYTDATNTLPTTLADEFMPYQLFYQLSEKETEEIDVHIIGQAPIITEGSNTVIVDSGLVWEKAKVKKDIGDIYYAFNTLGSSGYEDCPLDYKPKTFKALYEIKDGSISDVFDKWTIGTSPYTFGGNYMYTEKENVDPQADYYVLYEMLDEEYNNQQATTKLTMEDNLRDSHENLEKVVADNTKEIAQTKQELLDTYLKGDGERVIAGVKPISFTSTNDASVILVFKKAFRDIPNVVATSVHGSWFATVHGITRTQCILQIKQYKEIASSDTINANWIAIGK